MRILNNIPGGEKCLQTAQVESPSVYDNLQRQKLELESRLKEINEAIDAMEKNPEVSKVLELLSRVR